MDLYTGTARIYKAGAAPGFLVHEGKACTVGEAGLPMGVLGEVNGQSQMARLGSGGSGGAGVRRLLVDGPGWVLKQLELSAAAKDPPDAVARTLVETARAGRLPAAPTTITAAVLRLEKN